MADERDPVAELLRRLDGPVAPDPAFGAGLRRRLLAELEQGATAGRKESPVATSARIGADAASWKERPRREPPARGRGWIWGRAVEGLAAAALILALVAGLATGWGLLPGRGERPATVPAVAQASPGPAVVPGAAMERGNAARSGEVAGPGPEGEPELRWRAAIATGEDGWIRGAPVVVDGVAYVVGERLGRGLEGPGAGYVFALDAASGAERWRTKVVAAGSGEAYVAAENPAVADGLVIVGTEVEVPPGPEAPDPEVVVDPETGEEMAMADQIETTGTLVALDAGTGAERWRVPIGRSGWLSPAVDDGVVYVSVKDAVVALDAATGAERWRSAVGATEPSEDGEVRLGSPAVGDGLVYVTDRAGIVLALDARTGAERWRFGNGGEALNDPVVAAGTVYVASTFSYGPAPDDVVPIGHVHALDAPTGALRWTYEADAQVWTLTVGAGIVTVMSERSGASEVIGLDAASGEERWSTAVEGFSTGAPVLAGGRLYFGTYKSGPVDLGPIGDLLGLGDRSYLYALDTATGDRAWRIETEVGTTAPAVAEGMVYLVGGGGGGRAGTLYAYGDD